MDGIGRAAGRPGGGAGVGGTSLPGIEAPAAHGAVHQVQVHVPHLRPIPATRSGGGGGGGEAAARRRNLSKLSRGLCVAVAS